jgi:hypothetical protein
MMLFFQARNGDFLAIDTGTNGYYLDRFGRDRFEGRARAVAGLVGSVCTTGISGAYLKTEGRRVTRALVPAKWRKAIGL